MFDSSKEELQNGQLSRNSIEYKENCIFYHLKKSEEEEEERKSTWASELTG
jgi:hypothetical protein